MTDMTVANTILAQLGGQRFVQMTGAKYVTGRPDGLSFAVGRNAKGVTHVRVTLTPADLYTVEFLAIRGVNRRTKAVASAVYAEDLRDVFTDHTGLYTSL